MMRARSSSWLLLCLVVLAALLAAEWRFQVGTGSGSAIVERGSAKPVASPAPRFALADRESFTETRTRPLFMPNRQPQASEASVSPEPVRPAAKPDANRYALSAIIIVDDERVALLTDSVTGGLSRVKEGESVAGWQVDEIREESAVLSNGGVREELALRTFGPPIAAPKARRLPAGARRQSPAQSAEAPANGKLPKRPRRPKRGPRQAQPFPGSQSN
jgi:hypothetical protein